MSTSEESPQVTLAGAVFEAFNDGDWNRLRGLVTDDVEFRATGSAGEVHDADEFIEFSQVMKAGVPDFRFEILEATTSGSVAILTIETTGTHSGVLHTSLGDFAPSGRAVRTTGRWMVRVDGTRVSSIRSLDTLGLLSQFGVPE